MHTTHFINLKSLSHYPTKKIIKVTSGVNYKKKEEHLGQLQGRITSNEKLQLKITNIDDFNKNKKLMPNHKQVLIKIKSEAYVPSIVKYTEPLWVLGDWDLGKMSLVNELWEVTYQDNLFDHPLFDDNNEWWKDRNNVDYFMKNYDIEKITNILKKWKGGNDTNGYTFKGLFDPVKLFSKYNVTDFSSTSKFLTERRNVYAEGFNSRIDSIKSDIIMIEHFKKTQELFNNNVSTGRIFPPFDFYKVYPYDLLSARLLTNMHEIAGTINGGREWIRDVGDIYSPGKIMKQISSHPTIDRDGHTGNTMYWTICTLQGIYKNGWYQYIGKIYRE